MVIIKQAFEHSCVLACFQSFLADHHVTYSQSKMIYKFPQLCYEGTPEEGKIDLAQFDTLATGLGIDSRTISAPFQHPQDREAVFIITTQPTSHCVRFFKFITPSSFWVMNPRVNMGCEKAEFEQWDGARFVASRPIVKFLKLK